MSDREHDLETLLERAAAQIEGAQPEPAHVEAASARVWERLANAGELATEAAEVEQIRGCDDYQALIPAYLADELPQARKALLDDHFGECVPCRRALKAAREGRTLEPVTAVSADHRRSRGTGSSFTRWALAAALLAGLGVSFLLMQQMMPAKQSATVASIDGDLFRIATSAHMPLAEGDTVHEGQSIRTGRDGGSLVQLSDGSLVEMRERSEIFIEEGRRGTTIHLQRGNVIVQAAEQRQRHLYVETDECLVSVTGTIFSVNHGTRGSRVSVIEGEVRVNHSGDETVLHPGDVVATGGQLDPVPVEEEIAWSRDLDHYLTLLEEIQALREEIRDTVAQPGLRYSSRLVDLMPEDTVVYAAVPNLSATIAETYRLVQARIAANPELAEAWRQQGGEEFQPMVDDVISRLGELGEYLGEELAVGAYYVASAEQSIDGPLVLAEVNDPAGLMDFIARQMSDAAEHFDEAFDGELVFVDDPFNPPPMPEGTDGLLFWLHDDLLVAGDGARITQVANILLNGANNPFIGSPLYQDIAGLYDDGVGMLLAVDLQSLIGQMQQDADAAETSIFLGVDNARHLLAEQKQYDDQTHHRVSVSFDEARHGMAAWLAEPAPMGSLEFISPEAKLVSAIVFKDPAVLFDELSTLRMADQNGGVGQVVDMFKDRHGVDLETDVFDALGGEFAFAIDGPLLPTPSWKLVLEVYDPARLQWAIEQSLAEANTEITSHGGEALELTTQEVSGRLIYGLITPMAEFHYTYVEGYLVAGPSAALVERAIRFRDSGYSITDSSRFTALMPADGRNNFSALVYQDLSSVLQAMAERMANGEMTDEQQATLDQLADEREPTLGYAYGDPDRITFAAASHGDTLSDLLLRGLGVKDPASWESLLTTMMEGMDAGI